MKEQILEVIEKEINPVLKLHMGRCELVDYKPETVETDLSNMGVATIKLSGGCVGCPSSLLTLYNGILPILEGHFPGIQIELEG